MKANKKSIFFNMIFFMSLVISFMLQTNQDKALATSGSWQDPGYYTTSLAGGGFQPTHI